MSDFLSWDDFDVDLSEILGEWTEYEIEISSDSWSEDDAGDRAKRSKCSEENSNSDNPKYKSSNKTKYKCPLCDNQYSTVSGFRGHVVRKHKRSDLKDMFSFNFAIFVAGFKSRSIPHISLYDTVVNIPTLHILGETDRVIPKDMSEEILCYYRDPKVVNHPGGHFIPASGQLKKIYLEFLHQMATLKIS